MRLLRFDATNFRCLSSVQLKFGPLTVLIGENDAGKSSTLDLLEIFLNGGRPDEKDYFCREEYPPENGGSECQKTRADFIEAILELHLEEKDAAAKPFALDGTLTVKKRWTANTVEFVYLGEHYLDNRYDQDFSKLKKSELEARISSFDPQALPALRSNPARVRWLQARAKAAPRTSGWIPASTKLGELLPRFERFRAIDYSNPDSLVLRTLKQVYEQVIYEEIDDGDQASKRLNRHLQEVKHEAESRIRDKVQELHGFITHYAPQVKEISYDPQINFEGGLRGGEFLINDGRGLFYLSRVGDGTKRRIFMAALDWDREVSVKQAAQNGSLRSILRGYDEPDTNLHYDAQRKMYQAISDIAEAPGSPVQIILCTHSLPMIDRAPAKSINLLRIRDGCTQVERLETDDDPGTEYFLSELAQELGITNTVMFYERCFVLIEGETEANALPLLYRSMYGRSLLEDGIRLINVKGNGAAREFLRLLGKNRQERTIAFLDRDTDTENHGRAAKLTRAEFKEAGFAEDFIQSRLVYIGTREFEDAFGDEVLALALDEGYPKAEGRWEPVEIAALRGEKKFSDALGKAVRERSCQTTSRWGKPEFGKWLGKACGEPEQVPAEILHLFQLARHVAGCEPG